MAFNRTWIAVIKKLLHHKHEIHIYSFADQNYLLVHQTRRATFFSTKEIQSIVTLFLEVPGAC
jgi:hypothetical protein